MWDFVDHQGLAQSAQQPEHFLYGDYYGDYLNAHNFCCNGIVSPYRMLYPTTTYEVQYYLQSDPNWLLYCISIAYYYYDKS